MNIPSSVSELVANAEFKKEWHRYPQTSIEVLISKLKTTDNNRILSKAYKVKNQELRTGVMIKEAYPKAIHGIRGVTPRMLVEQFGFDLSFDQFTDDSGQVIPPDQHMKSEPIDDIGLKTVMNMALKDGGFEQFIREIAFASKRERDEEEDEKKT